MVVGAKKKDATPILWSNETSPSFLRSKEALSKATLLAFPREGVTLRLVTDASTVAAGAVLEQETNSLWQPLGFFSKKFTSGQKKYAPYDLELTAIFLAIKHFHYELEGREFSVYCDHKPLQYAFVQAPEHAPLVRQRQLSYISQYTTSIKYIPGSENVVADALSRMPTSDPTSQHLPIDVQFSSHIDALSLPAAFSLQRLSEEQQNDEQLHLIISDPDFPLPLQKGTFPVNDQLFPIYFNVSNDSIRPYVPTSLRQEIFNLFHQLAHPGPSATQKIISRKYVWPKMSKDIASFVKHCLPCQQAKIARHTKMVPAAFPIPDERFQHVHLDLVTLVPSEGFSHALTMIDRYARWPEAVPIADMQAATVARAFIDTWVARYGVPETITTDQGAQFEHELFRSLCKLLGINKTRTTGYHPQSNGILERWHRDFKSALMCFESNEGWTRILPLVMLGLRTRVRSDIDASPAEVVFGSTLRLPGELFVEQGQEHDCNFFTAELRSFMKAIKPIPVELHDRTKPFVHKPLPFCSHVLVRAKPIKKALDPHYLGPYKVHLRPSKYFYIIRVVNRWGVEELKTVSTSRLKPAFGTFDDVNNPVNLTQSDTNLNENNQYNVQGTDLCDNFDNEVEIKDTQVNETQKANPNKKKALPSRTKNNESNAQSSLNKKSVETKKVNQAPKPRTKKTVSFKSDPSYSAVHKKVRK
uniref:RNA-directed DNA polymerase n=1 Tax=Trichogramma kaykai TaxID=54128 RepID=A0ABD2WXN6_9HYME